jgi:hypothetical protein
MNSPHVRDSDHFYNLDSYAKEIAVKIYFFSLRSLNIVQCPQIWAGQAIELYI